VYSPSAEVQGHGPGQEVLQTGKRDVGINTMEPVGNYAQALLQRRPRKRPVHLEYLYQLGSKQDALWPTICSAGGGRCGPRHAHAGKASGGSCGTGGCGGSSAEARPPAVAAAAAAAAAPIPQPLRGDGRN
jgi:hypothetical protein